MREKEEIGRAISLLADRSDSISTSAKIRQHYAEIARALDMGVQVKAVVSTLNENGITISEKSFPTTWARIKKRERLKSSAAPPSLRSNAENPSPHASDIRATSISTASAHFTSDPTDISAIARSEPDMNQLMKAGRKPR